MLSGLLSNSQWTRFQPQRTSIHVKHFCLSSAHFYFPELLINLCALRQTFSFIRITTLQPRSLPHTVKRTNTGLKTTGGRVFNERKTEEKLNPYWVQISIKTNDTNVCSLGWEVMFVMLSAEWQKKNEISASRVPVTSSPNTANPTNKISMNSTKIVYCICWQFWATTKCRECLAESTREHQCRRSCKIFYNNFINFLFCYLSPGSGRAVHKARGGGKEFWRLKSTLLVKWFVR